MIRPAAPVAFLCLLFDGALRPAAAAPPAAPTATVPVSVDGGFRLEPRPVIDDVFGDSNEYRRIVDRFTLLGDNMQRTRDDFARAVQTALASLQPAPGAKPEKGRRCPDGLVAQPYARALKLGRAYLAAGRELSRHYEQVREFDRLGESLGLTPDYRLKVKRVVAQYNALLVDYREMKVAFHDQLADELRYAGCDLDKLAQAGATAIETAVKDAPREAKDEAWPGELTAPAPAPGDDKAAIAEGPPPPPAGAPPAKPPVLDPIPLTGLVGQVAPDRSGILFYVDNTRCSTATSVAIDGHALGDVPPSTRAAFQSTPGPHDLCLLPSPVPAGPGAKKCGEPGTLRRSYLHEGWTISLRCE